MLREACCFHPLPPSGLKHRVPKMCALPSQDLKTKKETLKTTKIQPNTQQVLLPSNLHAKRQVLRVSSNGVRIEVKHHRTRVGRRSTLGLTPIHTPIPPTVHFPLPSHKGGANWQIEIQLPGKFRQAKYCLRFEFSLPTRGKLSLSAGIEGKARNQCTRHRKLHQRQSFSPKLETGEPGGVEAE